MNEFKLPKTPNCNEPNNSKGAENKVRDCGICPYIVPDWSAKPKQSNQYELEVYKSGVILEKLKNIEQKAVWKIGRLPQNDIEMAHPTISRFHAVLQFRPSQSTCGNLSEAMDVAEGWYIYDLGSTHGTFVNKKKVPSYVYVRVKVGFFLKFGASTRMFILQGPADVEHESVFSITEMNQNHQKNAEIGEGISWGISEDAYEETADSHNPYSCANNEEIYKNDPKKALHSYFELEGLQLKYQCVEMSNESFFCKLELPLNDTQDKPIVVEAMHKGLKKDCVSKCALKACRILDQHGLLQQIYKGSSKRPLQNKDSDSDDEFWDRTGDIEKKRQKTANLGASLALTYDDLVKKAHAIDQNLKEVKGRISDYQRIKQKLKQNRSNEHNYDLDELLVSLNDASSSTMDKTGIRKLYVESQRLTAERRNIDRLMKVAKPFELIGANSTFAQENTHKLEKKMPLIGKRQQFSKLKIVKLSEKSRMIPVHNNLIASEEEESFDSENNTKSVPPETNQRQCNPVSTIKLAEYENCGDVGKAPDSSTKTIGMNQEEIPAKINKKECVKTGLRKEIPYQRHTHYSSSVQYNKRSNEDIEFDEKYSKWTPPENQIGDGITSLNERYGY